MILGLVLSAGIYTRVGLRSGTIGRWLLAFVLLSAVTALGLSAGVNVFEEVSSEISR